MTMMTRVRVSEEARCEVGRVEGGMSVREAERLRARQEVLREAEGAHRRLERVDGGRGMKKKDKARARVVRRHSELAATCLSGRWSCATCLRATGASRRPTRLCGVYAWRQLRCDSQPAQSHLKTIGSRPERSEDGRDEDRDSGPADPASRIVLDDIRSCSEGRVRPAREGPRRAARKSTAASRQQINSLLRVPTRRRCFPSPF